MIAPTELQVTTQVNIQENVMSVDTQRASSICTAIVANNDAKQESSLCNSGIYVYGEKSKEEQEKENVVLIMPRERRPTWDANFAGNVKYAKYAKIA